MADTGNSSGQSLSGNIEKSTVKMKSFTKEVDASLQKANALLKVFGMPQMGGGSGGGGAGNITTAGTFTNGGMGGGVGSAIARVGATVLGVAAGAAQALPGVQEVLGTQLLTSQARFSGVANPIASAQAAMRGGQATSVTDVLQAIQSGAQGGLVGALPGYGGILNGVSQLSNLTGSASSAMKAAAGLNSAQSVNTLRMFGIQARGANGAARPASEVFKDIYNFASAQVGRKLTPQEVAISLQPGNGLANFLDAAASGNSDLRNALQLAAQQYAKGGDLTRASTNATGLTTAAQGAQSNLFAAQLGTEAAAAPAMSKGFIEGADLLSKWNAQLTHTLETSKLANDAVKQLAKAETIAADNIGKSGLSILSVLGASGLGAGAFAGIKSLISKFGTRAALAGAAATETGVTAEVVGGAETAGLSGPVVAAATFLAGMVAPSIAKKIISGSSKGSTGLGNNAKVSGPTVGGTNLSTGNVAVGVALTQQGVPYSWGGGSTSGPTTGFGSGSDTVGFDCSSFVRFVMAKVGVVLPRTSQEQQKCGTQINPIDAQPGDLLFWGNPAHHVGIYMGNGMMIEAPHTGDVVKRTGVNLKSVTSCSRILGKGTGTQSVSNIMHAASSYKAVGNYGYGNIASQVSVNELRGNTAQDAMSGGTSSSSGLGFGESTSVYSGASASSSSQRYMFINPKTGTLETSNNANGTVINYGGVTVDVKVPQGTQLTAKDVAKAVKDELKSLNISAKVATK